MTTCKGVGTFRKVGRLIGASPPFPSSPFPSLSYPPLEVGPFKLGGLGERCILRYMYIAESSFPSDCPSKLPLYVGDLDSIPSDTLFLRPTRVFIPKPKRHLEQFSRFCTAYERDRQTHRQTYRQTDHDAIAAMRSKKKGIHLHRNAGVVHRRCGAGDTVRRSQSASRVRWREISAQGTGQLRPGTITREYGQRYQDVDSQHDGQASVCIHTTRSTASQQKHQRPVGRGIPL